MEELFAYLFSFGLLGLLIFILIIIFIKWIISSSVKKAMYDVLYEQTFYDNLMKANTYSTLNALNNENMQNTIAMGVLKALEQYNNGKTNERPSE